MSSRSYDFNISFAYSKYTFFNTSSKRKSICIIAIILSCRVPSFISYKLFKGFHQRVMRSATCKISLSDFPNDNTSSRSFFNVINFCLNGSYVVITLKYSSTKNIRCLSNSIILFSCRRSGSRSSSKSGIIFITTRTKRTCSMETSTSCPVRCILRYCYVQFTCRDSCCYTVCYLLISG